eukprot:TRINITY_DN6639_c0_g3_i1.p1 TRINITY_DN6639_c0_g3~~TRINITY_DN6639_c0_g3_i1.p1  ORF type:complete len:181 (-),score=16.75 TRINITY_DN6639_c0_g3_i1:168-710(-)
MGRRREPSYSYSCSRSPTPRRNRDRDRRGDRRDRSRSRRRDRSRSRGRGRDRSRGRGRPNNGRGDRGGDRRPPPLSGSKPAPRTPSRDGSPRNAEIWNLLIDREKARVDRDFSKADSIRDRLRAGGVEIYDIERKWEAKDGRVGARPSHEEKYKGDEDEDRKGSRSRSPSQKKRRSRSRS